MKVLSPTTYEQREPLYETVKKLILNGFLSHKVRLGDSTIVLRNLTSSDSIYLDNCTYDSNDSSWMLWTIARSIWMVDGMIVLGEKNSSYFMYQQIKGLSEKTIKRLFQVTLALTSKVNSQAEEITAFLKEDYSRVMWEQLRSHSLPSERINGIAGSESLGMNLIQKIWSSYNSLEDSRIAEQKAWSNAKFIASANAPKAIEKINKKEQSKLEQISNRKKRELDEFYYRSTGVITGEKGEKVFTNKEIKSATTAEELENEMRMWVSGEQDHHDKIVSAYKNRIKREREEDLLERQKILEEMRNEVGEEEEIQAISPLIGYTHEQLSDLLKQKGRSHTKIKQVFSESNDNLYNKHVSEEASTGRLKVRDGKIVIKGSDNALMEDLSKNSLTGGIKDDGRE